MRGTVLSPKLNMEKCVCLVNMDCNEMLEMLSVGQMVVQCEIKVR